MITNEKIVELLTKLEGVSRLKNFKERGDTEFPMDYENTYDLGKKDGKIDFARALLVCVGLPLLPPFEKD
jgi:hypothetical protein